MNQLQEKQHFIEEDEIDLLDILKTILSYKKLLVVVTFVVTVLAVAGGYLYNRNKLVNTVVLSLDYPGVTQGKNPDGTAFSVRELIPMQVLERVYNEDSGNIKEKNILDFEDSFQIKPILSEEIKTKIANAKKSGEIFTYFPTKYEISTKNSAIVLNKVVNMVVSAFVYDYKPKTSIAHIGSIDTYDYPEIEILLNSKLNELKEIAENGKTKNFISTKLGYSFSQILSQIEIIQKVELREIESYIQVNGLTLNESLRNVVYKSQIKDLKLEKSGLISKAEVVKQMLRDYKITGKTYVIPNIGEVQGKINIGSDYYSRLIEEYLSINNKIKDVDVSIEKLEDAKKNIKISTIEEKKELNKKFKIIVDKINVLVDQLNIISNEYIQQKYSQMIRVAAPVITINNGKPLIVFAVGGIMLGLLLSFFFIFIAEVRKEYIKK